MSAELSASDRARLAALETELANPRTAELDTLTTAEAVERMLAEDALVAEAVRAAGPQIAAAVDLVTERLANRGKLFYLGAGTSGRLGVLDASECPPTFGTAPELVQGLIAGGAAALTGAVEGAEDDPLGAARELDARGLGAGDAVLGISASGHAPWVRRGLAHARERGAATLLLCCVSRQPDEEEPEDVTIRAVTGPEVITGSTRLKAGTATKLVLNLVSTLTMVKLGKVHGNRMVDLDAGANAKLTARAARMVAELCGVDAEHAAELLQRAGGRVKTAVVMNALGLEAREAEERLKASGGVLRHAVDGES